MTKHTNAPWIVKDHPTETCQIIGNGAVRVADVWCTDLPCGAENAALIAASPDLLEGCKSLLKIVDAEPEACGIYKEHIAIARTAIQKATI